MIGVIDGAVKWVPVWIATFWLTQPMQAPLDSAQAPAADKEQRGQPGVPALAEGPARFIPVSRHGLRARLAAMLNAGGGGARAWARALDCLAAWRHQQHRKRLLDLLEDYLPFSPDSDTASLLELSAKDKDKARAELIAGIEQILVQANYVRLSLEDMRRLINAPSAHGRHLNLKVDLSDFDELLLYYRGIATERREERNPQRLYLSKYCYDARLFKRLFLLLKLKPIETLAAEIAASTGVHAERALTLAKKRRSHLPKAVSSDYVYVKVFKQLPQLDLEMLFPNTKIAFKPFDKLRLAVTAGGGTAAGVMGTASKLLAATNPLTLAGGLAGLSAVIFRQVMKFFNTRNRYMMVLAQNLYFCTLANNRGALTYIADAAEEEDVKEDMLLYSFLARHPSKYDALPEIKREIVNFLAQECGVQVDFDVEDALRRLLADGLVRSDADGNLSAIAPSEARAHLDALWDRLLDTDTLDRATVRT